MFTAGKLDAGLGTYSSSNTPDNRSVNSLAIPGHPLSSLRAGRELLKQADGQFKFVTDENRRAPNSDLR